MNMCSYIHKYTIKVLNEMNQISHDEAQFLANHGVHCPKTCRLKRQGKARGKYYCPDDKHVLELLEAYRKTIKVVEIYPEN